jgi:hypothetical protein
VIKGKDDNTATVGALLGQPGIDGAMNPSFGSNAGLNEGGGKTPGNGLGLSSSGMRVQVGDVTVDGRVGPQGVDRAGVSYLTQNQAGNFVGVKGLVVRDTSGSGVNIMVAGEWWHIAKNSYIGVVAGGELRAGIDSAEMHGDTTMTTLAPMAAVNFGWNGDLIGSSNTRFRLGWFVNGKFQLVAPLVLNAPARDEVKGNSNGISAGGIIDPGFLGASGLNLNGGLGASYLITPKLTLSGTATARVEGQDPTLNGSPVAVGGVFDARLAYKGNGLDLVAGGSAGYGIYDRDVLWRLYGGVGVDAGKGWTLAGQAGAGQFMGGDLFANANVGVTKKLGDLGSVGLGGGAILQKSPDQKPVITPVLGIQGTF